MKYNNVGTCSYTMEYRQPSAWNLEFVEINLEKHVFFSGPVPSGLRQPGVHCLDQPTFIGEMRPAQHFLQLLPQALSIWDSHESKHAYCGSWREDG